jgi:hypothetical protein
VIPLGFISRLFGCFLCLFLKFGGEALVFLGRWGSSMGQEALRLIIGVVLGAYDHWRHVNTPSHGTENTGTIPGTC